MDSRLAKIEHLVVLMMENRSFDHLLAYLTLDQGRTDINGPTGNEFNLYQPDLAQPPIRVRFVPGPNRRVRCDPPHDFDSIAMQLANHNGGFVNSYMRRWSLNGNARADDVMIYFNASTIPVYDFLAREFCICDRWHASIPGPTWPNRMYAMAGTSRGITTNDIPPAPGHTFRCLFDVLVEQGVDWRYYESDVGAIRLFANYLGDQQHVKFIEDPADGFFARAAAGRLPAVTYIDPDFEDVPGPSASDDHPPAHVSGGQALIARIYRALASSPNWSSTMFVITYDEHGGFFDHVEPGAAEDEFIPKYGVRVPAFVISPYVGRTSVRSNLYDHSSIIKTALERFCPGVDHRLGRRVERAADLSATLVSQPPRAAPALTWQPPPGFVDLGTFDSPPTSLQASLDELKRRRDAALHGP